MSGVRRKWRPPLALVIGGTLAAVLCMPLIAIGYFRVAGNILGWAETAWLFGFLALTATTILGFLLWRLVLRPVYALTAHARAVRAGRSGVAPPDHFGTPEFSELGRSVIDMGETLQNRANSLRAYADHVTHELKSPLTAITGAAELLEDDMPAEDRAALARTIRAAAARMEQLLTDLRRHAEASQSRSPGESDIAAIAARVTVPGLEIDAGKGGKVPLSPDDLEVVLAQMAQNAGAHGAGRLSLNWTAPVLKVEDDGAGVAEGNRDRLFDPFFTTRRNSGGTGMGLSIVHTLLASRGARIAHIPTPTGARFDIVF